MHALLTAAIILGGLSLLFGLLLTLSARRFRVEGDPVVDQINAVLPQTQCGQCGFPGCRPYAEAIAAGEVEINRCPPGGESGIKSLADLLGREPLPLDPDCGEAEEIATIAVIDENRCIGCTLCIQACPVDAILGSSKRMHTVIESHCTGCDLCVEPCPVDCIDMVPRPLSILNWRPPKPERRMKAGATAPPGAQRRAASD